MVFAQKSRVWLFVFLKGAKNTFFANWFSLAFHMLLVFSFGFSFSWNRRATPSNPLTFQLPWMNFSVFVVYKAHGLKPQDLCTPFPTFFNCELASPYGH